MKKFLLPIAIRTIQKEVGKLLPVWEDAVTHPIFLGKFSTPIMEWENGNSNFPRLERMMRSEAKFKMPLPYEFPSGEILYLHGVVMENWIEYEEEGVWKREEKPSSHWMAEVRNLAQARQVMTASFAA